MDNISDFGDGDIIQSIYSGISYKIISRDKNGMAALLNFKTEKMEHWNAYNNRHFFALKGQLNLFNQNKMRYETKQ